MGKYEKPTIATFKAKSHKELSFEERAKRFEEAVKPIIEEYGVNYMAIINPTQTAITAVCVVIDLWQNEHPTKNSKSVENVGNTD